MLSGFNTNIRHRGVLFHVQTEDSGRANPRIVTHLYYRGTILASRKSEYRDVLDAPDLEGRVKERMERQHREMLQSLRSGAMNAVIDERLDSAPAGRPAEVTGSTTQPDPPTLPPASPEDPPARSARPARSFGQSVVSDRSLDEVVLEYLVDNARKRKRAPR